MIPAVLKFRYFRRALMAAASFVVVMPPAFAYPDGITGRTERDGGAGCTGCHSVTMNKTLTVSIVGTSVLNPGQAANYAVVISGAEANYPWGVNIAARRNSDTAASNSLSESSADLQKVGNEITHTGSGETNASGNGSYIFTFTMPAGATLGSTYRLYATARAYNKWNHATAIDVTAKADQAPITALYKGSNAPGNEFFNSSGTLSITGGSGGGAVTFSESSSTCSISSGTTLNLTGGAGTCTVTATKAATSTYMAATDNVTITIVPAPQTIDFDLQADKTYSPSGTFTLSGPPAASSNLVLSYSSQTTGICTKPSSGTSVNIEGAGDCKITASQDGNANWQAADSVQHTIKINKASQTINFPAQSSKTFVLNGTFAISPSATATSGEPVTYVSQTPLICTTPGTTSGTVTMLDSGTCTIRASRGSTPNYNAVVTPVDADILITDEPGQPILGTLYSGDNRVTATFTAPANASSILYYTLTCLVLGQTTRTGTSTTPSSPIVVTNLVDGIQYGCRINATNSFGTGLSSPTEFVTPSPTPLAAPVLRSGNLVTFKIGQAKTFDIVSTGKPNATLTRTAGTMPAGLTFATGGRIVSGTAEVSGTATGPIGTFAQTITATNSMGSTSEGLAITIAKGDQTITFPTPADRPYSPTPFALTATSSAAGHPVTYTLEPASMGICSVSGSNVTMLALGICSIKANQAGSATYNAAPSVVRSFEIEQAPQTITFNAAAPRTFAPGLTFTINPLASTTSNLLIAYQGASPSVCTLAGTTVTVLTGGNCILVANQGGNALYLPASSVQQVNTINAATQTINFPAQASQSFVQEGSFQINPVATASSGLPVSYQSLSPAICDILSGTEVSILGVGACQLRATQTGSASYSAAPPMDRTVTINAVAPGSPALGTATPGDSKITLAFGPPASNGGSAVTGYLATCTPGPVQASGAGSPLDVTGLANGTPYACSVVAQNAQGNSAPSNVITGIVPFLETGANLWTNKCSVCHGATPSAARFNAAGETGTVLNYVRANQATMLTDPGVQALTANELSEIAKYIKTFVPAINVTTNYVTPKMIDVGLPNHLYLGGVAFTDAEVVSPPTNGTLSVFSGTLITYTPNAGFAGTDSFTYRGKRTSPQLVQGEARTVTIMVNTPPAPLITSGAAANGVFNQPFSYQITATNSPASFGASGLPPGVTVNATSGLVSGTPTTAGSFNALVSATNPGGTGQLTVAITISAANQTITFGAQAPQSFAPSGVFEINPLANATSGLSVTYSSTTPGVCSVSGSMVTMLTAGTCTIAASQGGDPNFNAALPVSQNVTINATVPGAPTIGTATPGNLQATIAFAAPINNGGSPITMYNATCSPSGTGSNTVSPIVVTGLTNNTPYTCSVTATNAVGTSMPSGSVMVTPVNANVPPQFTSAANTEFTVLSPNTFNVTASGTPAPTLTLQSGALPMGVTFVNGVLSGMPASGTSAGSPYYVVFLADGFNPDATQNFALTVVKQNQTITFNNPGAQNFSFISIPLSASASSGLGVTLVSNSPSVCTVSGNNLTTVTTGTCSITASQAGNADVNGATSITNVFQVNPASQSINFGAQTSPRNFSAIPFALSPVAFATSGLPITYSTTTPSVCTANGSSITTHTAGSCTIAANQAGNQNYAAAMQVTQNVTINAIAPGAPTIGTATGSDQQASIAFTAPSSNGGSPITQYTATCSPSGSATGNASPIVVTGLTNGQSYTCSVTATNMTGLTSVPSGSVNVTPTSANGAALWGSVCTFCHSQTPSGNQLNGAGSTATVLQHVRSTQTLMAIFPAVQNLTQSDLAAIAVYIRDQLPANNVSTPQNTAVLINVGGHITFTNQPWSAFTSVEVVTPPTNGTLSTFTGTTATYTPTNGFTGTDSFTYRGKRSAPDVLGDAIQVTITVQPGAPVITSPLTANGTFNAPFIYQIAASGSPTSFGATGLPNGFSVNAAGLISATPDTTGMFTVAISATNSGGTTNANLVITIGAASQAINFPAQSTPSRNFVQGGSFAIDPVATGGASGLPVTYGSSTPGVCTVSGTTVSLVAAGTCTITANQAGNANYSPAPQVTQIVLIGPVAPNPPTIGTASPGNMSAQIAFTAPAFTGGANITGYNVACTPNGMGTGMASPIAVMGLTNGVTYACSVTATGPGGTSMPSQAVNVTPQQITVPDAPVIGVPVALNGSANIPFTPPVNNGGSVILNYTATCNPGMFSNTGTASPIAVSGLTNGVTYSCSVIATNAIGSSAPSATLDVTPFAPIALDRVVSRKMHGVIPGEVPLNTELIGGNIAVEPRLGSNGHQIVFVFTGSLGGNPGAVSVTDAMGMPFNSVTANVTADGSEAIVNLSNVPEIVRLTVSLTNVAGSGVNASASIGFLPGDVSGSRRVTAADIAAVKSRSGHTVTMVNFHYDLNVTGSTINSADIGVAKARAGQVIP